MIDVRAFRGLIIQPPCRLLWGWRRTSSVWLRLQILARR
jgi:hypothetical protein